MIKNSYQLLKFCCGLGNMYFFLPLYECLILQIQDLRSGKDVVHFWGFNYLYVRLLTVLTHSFNTLLLSQA